MSKDNKLKTDDQDLHLKYCFEYGVDFKNRVIQINEDIDEGLFSFIDAAMSEMERQSKKTITIRICSYGGSIYEALGAVGRIKNSTCKIVTEGYGKIMSAATLLLASGDRRKMSQYGWLMHHAGYYHNEGRWKEVMDKAEQIEREENQWAEMLEIFTGTDKKHWLESGKHTDKYYSAKESLELGIVDEII